MKPNQTSSPLRYYTAAFLLDMAFGLSATSSPWLVTQQFRANEAVLGSIMAGGTLLYTCLALGAGSLARRANPRVWGTLGAAVTALSYSAIAFAPGLLPLAVGLWCSSAGLAVFWPALQTRLCGGVSPDELRKRVARFNFSWSAGLMTGPLLAGRLYPVSHRAPYLAAGAAAAVVALIILGGAGAPSRPVRSAEIALGDEVPAGTPNPADAGSGGGAAGGEGSSAGMHKGSTARRVLGAAWCANFVSYFAGANVRSFYPVLATAQHISVRTQGALLFALGLVQTAVFFGLEHWTGWRNRRLSFFVSLVLLVGAMLLLTAGGSPALHLIAFTLCGLGTGVLYSLSLFHSLSSEEQSRNAGIHESIIGGSGLCGALAGGFTGAAHGFASPFYLAAAVVAAGFIPVFWLLRGGPRRG